MVIVYLHKYENINNTITNLLLYLPHLLDYQTVYGSNDLLNTPIKAMNFYHFSDASPISSLPDTGAADKNLDLSGVVGSSSGSQSSNTVNTTPVVKMARVIPDTVADLSEAKQKNLTNIFKVTLEIFRSWGL